MDLIRLDKELRQAFEQEKELLPGYYEQLRVLKSLTVKLNTIDVDQEIKNLEEIVQRIESNSMSNSYHLNSMSILSAYKKLVLQPKKISFVGKKVNATEEEESLLVNQYIAVSNPYREAMKLPLLVKPQSTQKQVFQKKSACEGCKGEELQQTETTQICVNCGYETDIPAHGATELSMMSNVKSGSYDRRVHFRDCINQYQGKQHCTIEKKVYDELKDEFRKNHLLLEDKEGYATFAKIKKEHVELFLKVLGYTKHYENVNLIHYNLTGKKPDDISYLEDTLMKDFDALTELYDEKFRSVIDRRNFINTPSVLYQLLRKHRHPCKPEDFVLLKTVERMSFHDSILEELFRDLGWSYHSTF